MGSKTKHVILVCYAAQGHINPMLEFAGRLACRAISITIATTAIGRLCMLKDSDKATTFEVDGNIKFEFFSDGSDPLISIIDLYDCIGRLEREGPESLAGLVEDLRVQGRKVTYMVTTPFTPWVIDLAKGLGIPFYGYYYRVFHRNGEEMEVPVKFPGLPHLNTYSRFPLLLKQLYEKLGDVRMVLGNSFDEHEPEEIWFAEGLHLMKLVGPHIPQVLLGYPTAPHLQRDMWEAPSNCLGIVVAWCPQVEVLSHPSLACFLTHCGWNSTLETVAAGVPVITFPQWTDQPTNAMFLVDVLRVGVQLKTDPAFVDDIMENGPIHEPKPDNGGLMLGMSLQEKVH
ncbi:hypothetical protein AMTRI_Chr12g236020 [Amborella trichopoda]